MVQIGLKTYNWYQHGGTCKIDTLMKLQAVELNKLNCFNYYSRFAIWDLSISI